MTRARPQCTPRRLASAIAAREVDEGYFGRLREVEHVHGVAAQAVEAERYE